MDEFIFKGIEGNQARIGLVVSEHNFGLWNIREVHDFLMTKDQVIANIKSFGSQASLKKAEKALSTSPRNICRSKTN